MINETLKKLSETRVQVSPLSTKALRFLTICLTCLSLNSCKQLPTRQEVEAEAYLNNGPIPAHICQQHPELNRYGHYRRLNSGRLELVSFCNAQINRQVSFWDDQFNYILDALLPKQQ